MQTLDEQAGQILMIGFEGQECGRELPRFLQPIRPGGVLFFQRNIATAEQFQALVTEIRKALGIPPLFLAMDLEGGPVDRLRDLLGPLPSAQDAARAGLARELGEMAGRELAAFSLNLNFAPVLDLASPESQTILGAHTAGGAPAPVIQFAEEFLEGLSGWNILGCGKHFPGLGGGRKDSHIGMPAIEKTAEALWREDLLPFRTLASRLPMIMVAHAWYPELEKAFAPGGTPAAAPIPASLSPNIVSGLLRERIGYQGLVISDDLEMGGALEGRSIEDAAVAAVRAGCDILLVCRHAGNVERVHAALVQEAEQSADFRAQLERAALRVLTGKQTFRFQEGKPPLAFADMEVLRRSIRRLGEEVRLRLARQTTPAHEESLGD